MSKEDPEHQSKEVCEEKHKRVDEKLEEHEERMDCYEGDIKTINSRILKTLIFVIIMLATLLGNLAYQVYLTKLLT